MKLTTETLLDCGHAPSDHSDFTSGWGEDPKTGKRYCYACCAERDKAQMRETGKAVLYLTTKTPTVQDGKLQFGMYGDCEVGNWPASLKIPGRFHLGSHNIARTRYDVWFKFEGAEWHGVTYGEWTQLCHCKRNKRN